MPVGAPVALTDGVAVGGDIPGTLKGAAVGAATGDAIGLAVDMAVGVVTGDREGAAFVASILPAAEGCEVTVDGFGPAVGMANIGPHSVGLLVGVEDAAGTEIGTAVGAAVALAVGEAGPIDPEEGGACKPVGDTVFAGTLVAIG